jgi:hypothetical protein
MQEEANPNLLNQALNRDQINLLINGQQAMQQQIQMMQETQQGIQQEMQQMQQARQVENMALATSLENIQQQIALVASMQMTVAHRNQFHRWFNSHCGQSSTLQAILRDDSTAQTLSCQ